MRIALAQLGLRIGAVCCWLVLGAACAEAAPAPPRRPFPQHVAYVTETTIPLHRTRAELDADVVAAWTLWKTRHLASAGTELDGRPRYRVKALDPGGTTVSEAQGYGMILAAFLAGADPAAREIFDGLYEFSRDHPSVVDARLFDWSVPPNEAPNPPDEDAAFDGDADIAYALLLADEQWGSAAGAIDYRARALALLAAILDAEIGPTSRLPLLGDWVAQHPDYDEWMTRTSDFMTGHFRVFEEVSEDPAWGEVRLASLAAARSLREDFGAATGLLPDFAVPTSEIDHALRPAPPNFLEDPNDGGYYYNAGRVPWRLGLDALHSGNELAWDGAVLITFWAEEVTGGVPQQLHQGYTLAGVPLDATSEFDSFFAGPMGVAALLAPELQPWLEALYDSVRVSDPVYFNYYGDTVSLLSMLVMTGNWWEPLPIPEPSALAQGLVVAAVLARVQRTRSGRAQAAPSL